MLENDECNCLMCQQSRRQNPQQQMAVAAPAHGSGQMWDAALGSAIFDRPMTLKAIGDMIEGLSDENIVELWEWLRAKYPPRKSYYGVRSPNGGDQAAAPGAERGQNQKGK